MKLDKTNMESEDQLLMEKQLRHVIEMSKGEKGSGVIQLMKPLFVSCSFNNKELVTKFFVEKWELNPQGSMHGGLICAAFDNTFGILTHFYAEDNFITTVDLATRFLKPIPVNSNIIIKVKACSTGKTIVSLTGEAYIEETGTLAATSSANFMILRNKKSQLKLLLE